MMWPGTDAEHEDDITEDDCVLSSAGRQHSLAGLQVVGDSACHLSAGASTGDVVKDCYYGAL